MAPRRLVVEADGGSRGNPGPAAYGTLVRDAASGEVLARRAEYLGTATNNVAEYRGVVAGLTAAREIDPDAEVEVRLDSKLIVEQLSGRWQVKHPDMRVLAKQAASIWPPGRVTYVWVPRAQNAAADRLVNEALDAGLAGRTWTAAEDVMPRTDDPVPFTDDVVPLAADAPPSKLVGWGHDLGVPTTFVLVRHGETAHSREKRFSGSGGIDPPLSADGRAQAAAVAAALGARGDVDAVVSSPLRRARETADLVGTVLGLDVVVDGDLAECAFGEWEGLTFAEVEERYPDELAAWLGSPAVAPPGGESFDSVERRVRAARDRLLVAYEGRTVVVVSHVTPVKTLVRLALDAPPRALHRMELAPAAMTTVLWFSDGNASLRSYNDVFHLDGLLPERHV